MYNMDITLFYRLSPLVVNLPTIDSPEYVCKTVMGLNFKILEKNDIHLELKR